MTTISTSGIILKQVDVGENDRLLLLFTAATGKVLVRGHGLRRPQNLTAGHATPWLPVDFLLKEGTAGWSLTEASCQVAVFPVSLVVLARLHLIAELVDRLTALNEPDEGLLTVLMAAGRQLAAGRLNQLAFVELLVKTTVALGVAPSTDRCVVSSERVNGSSTCWWSSVAGGVVLKPPAADRSLLLINNQATLKLIRALQHPSFIAERVKVTRAAVDESQYLLLDYMQVLVQQNLRALSFVSSQRPAREL